MAAAGPEMSQAQQAQQFPQQAQSAVEAHLDDLLIELLSQDHQLQSYLETHHPTESVRCGALVAMGTPSDSASTAASGEELDSVCHSDQL